MRNALRRGVSVSVVSAAARIRGARRPLVAHRQRMSAPFSKLGTPTKDEHDYLVRVV